MARSARYLTAYWLDLSKLRIGGGGPASRAVARTVDAICAAADLPLPGDGSGPLPAEQADLYERSEGRRLASAFWRRVRGHRLYVWYAPRGASVVNIVAVTRVAP